MRKLLIPLFALFAVSLCPPCFAGDEKKESPYVFEIQQMTGGAHGCAVNGLVLTNRHVVDPRRGMDLWTKDLPQIFFRYEFPDGTIGRGNSQWVSLYADFAILSLDKEPPQGYAPLAQEGPKVGDKVYWWEYDFRKVKDVLQPRRREGTVVNLVAGNVLLETEAERGASGGCAFNEDGEAVGLLTFKVNTKDLKEAAGVVSFWGFWWEDLERE
jgi:hypothetical protein